MQFLLKLIRPIWLVVLLAMSSAALPILASAARTVPILFAYDGQNQTSTAYDEEHASPVFDYDSDATRVASEKEIGAAKAGSPFADFSKFLAAEGATLFSRELGSEGSRATTELLDAMRAHGRTVTIAGEGSEGLRFLDAMGAEASVGGPGHLNILLRENPSRAAAMEEFLHGTQDRLGIIDRLGVQGAESHVADFMTRHSRLLGLEP